MLNFEIDPALLEDLVPAGTELDDWAGRTLVSMVGFRFLETRVHGLAIPFHRDFSEVNLRFYVRREVGGSAQRGVVFVQEIVPRMAIAWVARRLYNENYVALPMRHELDREDSNRTSYAWRTGDRWHRLVLESEPPASYPEASSEEEFVTEHYWGYVGQRDGSTLEYRVDHPQWRVRNATFASLDCDVARLYGARFAEALASEPRSAFLAIGSEVAVYRGRPIG